MAKLLRDAPPPKWPENTKGQGFTWKSPHHAYWGIIIFLIGFAWVFHCPAWGVAAPIFLMITGLLVVIDDAIQHVVQLITGNYAFHTPVHNIYWGALNWLLAHTAEGSWQRRLLLWMRSV